MNKRFLFVFLLLSIKLFSQDLPVKTEVGIIQDINSESAPLPTEILYSDSNGYLVLSSLNSVYFIQRLNLELKVEKSIQVNAFEKQKGTRGYTYCGFLLENKLVYLFWDTFEKKDKQFICSYLQFNPSTGEQLNEMTELLRSRAEGSWVNPTTQKKNNFFKIVSSPDKKLFSIVCQTKLKDKPDSACVMVTVIDSLITIRSIFCFLKPPFNLRK